MALLNHTQTMTIIFSFRCWQEIVAETIRNTCLDRRYEIGVNRQIWRSSCKPSNRYLNNKCEGRGGGREIVSKYWMLSSSYQEQQKQVQQAREREVGRVGEPSKLKFKEFWKLKEKLQSSCILRAIASNMINMSNKMRAKRHLQCHPKQSYTINLSRVRRV